MSDPERYVEAFSEQVEKWTVWRVEFESVV